MPYKVDFSEGLGLKLLSSADLDDSSNSTSNQTHIGLMERSLLYLAEAPDDTLALVYYNGTMGYYSTMYGRIAKTDGGYRSPKIRSGNADQHTVTRFIRGCAAAGKPGLRWYLMWATLENKQPVFILFNDESQIFQDLANTGLYETNRLSSNKKTGHYIDATNVGYRFIVNYIESLLNNCGLDEARELETAVLAGEFDPNKYTPSDISKARKTANATGLKGELLIDAYLQKLLCSGEIRGYTWMNRDEESFTPYDFQIINNDGETLYVDVKTTGYNFDNPVIFSSNEVKFIHDCPTYRIYRVFENEGHYYLRICSNAREHFSKMHAMVEAFKKSSSELMRVCEMTLSVKPSVQTELIFDEQINIDADPSTMMRIKERVKNLNDEGE